MVRPYGEGIVFNILMKVIYIAYLAMYMAYAVLNYIAETGNDLVNFIVISFISVSIVIFIIANVMDWVYKNADARSKIKVRLHTLRNVFKIIKVGVTILVLAQTITDDSWNALTITMLVISLPTSLLWLLGEYIYVAVKGIFRRGGKTQSEDTDEEYDDVKRVTPVHDTIERVKQFAESELIVMRPHEVDYDSDEEEDVEDRYLGYEEDDDYSYSPSPRAALQPSQGEYIPERRAYPEYEGIFTVEAMPMTEDAHDFSVEEYDMNAVLGSGSKEECGGENADVPPADGGKQRAGDGDTPAEGGGAPMSEPAPQNGQNEDETTVPEDIFEDMIPGQAAEDISGEALPEQVAQDKPEESAPEQVAQDKPEESAPVQLAQDNPEESAPVHVAQDNPEESAPVQVAQDKPGESAPEQVAQDKAEESAPEQVAQDKPEESAPEQVAQDKPEESVPVQVAEGVPGESAEELSFEREIKQTAGDKGEE